MKQIFFLAINLVLSVQLVVMVLGAVCAVFLFKKKGGERNRKCGGKLPVCFLNALY